MNLVKIQEDLKGMPLQALQQYVNGGNPEVPPYLAAAEMQRREATMKRASMAQGAAQGPQPSVKEQLEQRLGLGALQAQQQQQAAQQMMQQSAQRPMPVPPGAPQPEAQPTPPEGMARGGVASLPVRDSMFAYADGGVIGFQSGGSSMYDQAYRQREQKGSIYSKDFGAPREERRKSAEQTRREALERQIARAEAALEATDVSPEYAQTLRQSIQRAKAEIASLGSGAEGSDSRFARGPMAAGITDQPPAVPTPRAAPAALPTPSAQPAPGPARVAGAAQRPAAATAPVGVEALAAQSVRDQLTEKIPEATEASGIASEQKFASQYGYDKPYGAEQRKLMDQMRADYEKRKEGRGLETLISTLAGGARGYGGTAAGYMDALRAQRAYDDQFAKDMLKQTGRLETVDRETALGRGKDAMGEFGKRRDTVEDRKKAQRALGASVYKQDEIAEAKAALEALKASAKGGGGDKLTGVEKERLRTIRNQIKSQEALLKKAIRPPEKAAIQAKIDTLRAQEDALLGGGEAPAPAAQSGTRGTKATEGFTITGSRPATP